MTNSMLLSGSSKIVISSNGFDFIISRSAMNPGLICPNLSPNPFISAGVTVAESKISCAD